MSLRKLFITGAAALGLAFTGAAAAYAAPMQSTTSLNVRSGPSTGYPVIYTLYAGQQVEVDFCGSGWCKLDRGGYASDRYLVPAYGNGGGYGGNNGGGYGGGNQGGGYGGGNQGGGHQGGGYGGNQGGNNDPDVGFCIDGPNFSFGVNCDDDRYNRPGRPGHGGGNGGWGGRGNDVVCFYEHVGYRGNSFCADRGDSRRYVGNRWNDQISSIKVDRGYKVQVCEHASYGGNCRVIDHNTPNVGRYWNDRISSFRVLRDR